MQHDASAAPGTAIPGRLIYLMGPSGAGKDSLIDAARATLLANQVQIAQRVITRSAEAKGEKALGVCAERFEQLCAEGAFALHWRANGLAYGIPVEIDTWLAKGHAVLVNGSRAHLANARERYPDLLAILLTVDRRVLRQRLLARGRESVEDIERRLARSQQLSLHDSTVHLLDNSTALEAAVKRLIALLRDEGLLAHMGTSEDDSWSPHVA
ncbi:phosphonate metabolism protein/1,5-bisphosphokinase (PRPP-forming) PhnN [Pseudomonas sp. GD03860]|uniref:phosphonate metabolism protein/1,5-bisphosphokinase (PRPP-forming) PhnN n=1 Tax=Pseudomonas TaxID=286 RepID=UPI002363CE0A|nr:MULTISPECIES: phosphonate metabolism protein/1,5-bisphosphokinase (PRPP-forming) PhnN [Pseudomonas]MDD2060816.1 phosphonate metabolism protein/1,5-bisphosphokinase (PRPP-forming) PhnN [Pseudomonas putida]MDH0638298.1 phosphonate metabolism protein/1,5-bisphosphokinase (PRPP-forming) PhnN [Pseudomonas sp. GD03860]